MKYIKQFNNFTPIKINNEKPFKIKKDILKSIIYLQKGIQSDTKRLQKEKNIGKRNKLSQDRNKKMQKLKELNLKRAKQVQYLRDNPITENTNNKKTLLEVLESETFKPDNILKYIGFDEDEYKIEIENNWRTGEDESSYDEKSLTMLINSNTLEHSIGSYDNGIIEYLLSFDKYNNNEHYVDDEELNYLCGYLNNELLEKIKKLSIIFKSEIDPNEEGEIKELFDKLGLESKLEGFLSEIQMEKEREIEKEAQELIKSLPYLIESKFNKDFNLQLYFEYDEIIKYIKKHNIEKVETIKEFIESVFENSDISYDFEYNISSENMSDYNDLKNEVENVVDDFIGSPDDVFLYMIKEDKLDIFKKNIDLAIFSYVYDTWIDSNRVRVNLFQIAKNANKDIYKWMITDEFENIMKKLGGEDLDAYYEFMYGENVSKYNM